VIVQDATQLTGVGMGPVLWAQVSAEVPTIRYLKVEGTPQGTISTAVCVQIGACTPNLLVQELFDEFNVGWESEVVTNPVHVVDGRIAVPDGPGLGTDVNWAEIEKHPYQVSNFLPLFAPGWERREGAKSAYDETSASVPAADQDAKPE
jgi:hypothetical protein